MARNQISTAKVISSLDSSYGIYIYIYIYTVPPLKIILLAYFDDDNDIITRRKLNCEKWNVRIFPSPSIKLSSSSNNLARVYRGGIIFCCVFFNSFERGKIINLVMDFEFLCSNLNVVLKKRGILV